MKQLVLFVFVYINKYGVFSSDVSTSTPISLNSSGKENVTLSFDWFWPFFQKRTVSDLPKLIQKPSILTAHRAIKN